MINLKETKLNPRKVVKILLYIYCFTNKINGKKYVGQTNNIENRKRGHKSDAFNQKSNGYKLPFHAAIRKYGWDSFNFDILEEIPESFGYDYVNQREKFFISENESLVSQKGYNICVGGQGCPRKKLSFEESVKLSKLFSEVEIRDIQQMLLENYAYFEILSKYPQLTPSFLSNINVGLNFIREDLSYPLSKLHSFFSKETREKIIEEIANGVCYKNISEKYSISPGLLSNINSGKKWRDDKRCYPLCQKTCADGAWSKNAKYDLIFTNLTHSEIGQKYNKQKSTITALNTGRNRKDNRLLYPLRQHQEENQKVWITLF